MKPFSIDCFEFTRLVVIAVVDNNKKELRTYKKVAQLMLKQWTYDYEHCNDEIELRHLEYIKQPLDKILSEIDKTLSNKN